MDALITIAQILLSLSILVGLHEMGHLLTAKMFGMRVEQFSIGFPPKLFRFNYGGTEYALSAIPLGGYVKISGMIDESLDTESLSREPQPWEFRSKPAWQRLIVMLGGIIVNVITGVVIFIALTFFWGDSYLSKDVFTDNGGILAKELAQKIGLQTGDRIIRINGQEFSDANDIINPKYLLEQNAYYTVLRDGKEVDIPIPTDFIENFSSQDIEFFEFRVPLNVNEVREGSYASQFGLKPGDKIIMADSVEVNYHDEFSAIVRNRNKDSLLVTVERGSEYLNLSGAMPKDSVTFGFSTQSSYLKNYEMTKTYSFGESISLGTQRAFGIVFLQIKAFGKMFSGDLNLRKSLSGPIGIAKAFGTDWDWFRFWRLTGLLSMVLAFMNLLPIPALDGGHVMFLTAEMVSGRKPSDKFLEIAQKIGMIILLALMVFIFANDILKLFNI